jgi:hypothetical protein
VLRAAAVLGAVGSSIEVVEPERGPSWRGTSDDKLSSGDVLRKLWVQLAQHVALNEPLRRPPCEQSQAVKVCQRAARRTVKGAVNVAEAEARAPRVAAKLLAWYHDKVGLWLFAYAQGGKGRRLQIVDTTHVEGPLATGPTRTVGW